MATIEKTKTVVTSRRHLKASSERRFLLNGSIVPVGTIVEVSLDEAENLLWREVAVEATPAEVEAAGASIIASSTRFDSWTDAA